MKIYYDTKKTNELNDALVEKWHEINEKGGDTHGMEEHESTPHGYEYHVSTVIYCPMKYICGRMGFERKITRESIGVMFFGIVAQKLIQWLYPPDEREYESRNEVILGHIDVYEKKLWPMEIKASRKRILNAGDLPTAWIDQLQSYMAMENARIGWIVIANPITCMISAFCVDMGWYDVQDTLDDIYDRVNHLNTLFHMITKEDPDWSIARIHPEEYRFCDFKKECPNRRECNLAYKQLGKK